MQYFFYMPFDLLLHLPLPVIMNKTTTRKGQDRMSENYAKIIETVNQQEDLLRFDHFSNRDAWELGTFLVQRMFDRGIDMAICIR